MNNAGPIALKLRAIRVARLRVSAPARFTGLLRKRREHCALSRLHLLSCLPSCAHVHDSKGGRRLRLHPLDERPFRIICRFRNHYEKTQDETVKPGAPTAVWLRLRATADHQRGGEQQSV